MKLKPVFLLFLIVAVPLALLVAVGLRLARHERTVLERQMQNLLADRLQDVDRSIGRYFDQLEREIRQLTEIDSLTAEALRERVREHSRLSQLFVIRPDGTLLYPDPLGALNRAELDFLKRISPIISDRELQRAAGAPLDEPLASRAAGVAAEAQARSLKSPGKQHVTVANSAGWYVWYWGRGLDLIYWQQRASGHIIGAALNRARWIADLIAMLPDTPQVMSAASWDADSSQIRLIDSASQTVYQWGAFTPPEGAAPACEISLSPPLAVWRLQQFLPSERLVTSATASVYLPLGTAMVFASSGLITLAIYFYREYARDMREAAQRVSFVNQVSHELRTPLTNICMYADLLETDLASGSEETARQSRSRLQVIQLESQRLSRLIGNVLTFARQQRNALQLSMAPCNVDRVVSDVLDRFRPSLAQAGVETEFRAGAPRVVLADRDALEQILGNLISNVEKYAVDGRWLGVTTSQTIGRSAIQVSDRGPGVDPHAELEIFAPFWRGSDSVNRVAGTGIGLSIARELARQHGGDLTLLKTDGGACFLVEIATPDAPLNQSQ